MFEKSIEEKIVLRILEERFAELDFKLIDKNRDYLRQWLPWVDSTKSSEDVKTFIIESLKQFADNKGFNAGIWYKGEFAGVIGFYGIDWGHRSISIGYWLGSEYTGQGITTKACKAMIEYAFAELKLHRVEIRCAESNKASRGIPERLGFKNEGLIRDGEWLYDHYVSHVVYGLLEEEWSNLK